MNAARPLVGMIPQSHAIPYEDVRRVLVATSRRAPWPMLATSNRFSPIRPVPLPGTAAAGALLAPVAPRWPQDRGTYHRHRRALRDATRRDALLDLAAVMVDPVQALYDGPSLSERQQALLAIGDPRMRKALTSRPSPFVAERVVLHGDQLRRRDAVLARVGVRRFDAQRRARIAALADSDA